MGTGVVGSVAKADQVSLVSAASLALLEWEGLNDKIKNFSENHLYSHPAPEPDFLYPSSAEGHGLPSSICKASAGSAASIHIPRRGGCNPRQREFEEQIRGCIFYFLPAR